METKKIYPSCLQGRFWGLFVALFMAAFVHAQTSDGTIVKYMLASGEPLYEKVEQMPEFPDGGVKGLIKYFNEQLRYPDFVAGGLSGRTTVQFIIDKDGSISDAWVLRGVDPFLDAEVLRVVRSMPRWKPGKQDGKEVAVLYTVPVSFMNVKAQFRKKSSDVAADTLGEPVYEETEQMPAFPGGMKALMDYLCVYCYDPQVYICEQGGVGRTTIRFVVNEDGSVQDAKVIRGVDPILDAEALRLLDYMPRWTPGMSGGRVVAMEYTAAVRYRRIYPEAGDISSMMDCLLELCGTSSWDNVWIEVDGKKLDSHLLQNINPNSLQTFLVLKNAASVAHFTLEPRYKVVLLITQRRGY